MFGDETLGDVEHSGGGDVYEMLADVGFDVQVI